MKTDIQTVNFDASQSLVQFIENELNDLEVEFDQIIGAEVYLRPGRSEEDNKTVKLKLNVPGPDLFAEFKANSYENGLVEALEKIRFQLYKMSRRNGNGRKK
jgi:putative sigma-54 modulation protein